MLALWVEVTKRKPGGANNPSGSNQHREADKAEVVNVDNIHVDQPEPPTGTSAAVSLRKLQKAAAEGNEKAAEALAEVIAGRKSVHAGCVETGLRKETRMDRIESPQKFFVWGVLKTLYGTAPRPIFREAAWFPPRNFARPNCRALCFLRLPDNGFEANQAAGRFEGGAEFFEGNGAPRPSRPNIPPQNLRGAPSPSSASRAPNQHSETRKCSDSHAST